jgi:hypothetical protein
VKRRFRTSLEWHEIRFEEYVIVISMAFFFLAVFIPTVVIMFLLSFTDFTFLSIMGFLFIVGLIYLVGAVRTFPNMIGLSDEKIILKYKKNEPREYYWGGISHIVFPKRGKGRVKIVTHHGDTILLRLSRRVLKRLKEYGDRAGSE